MSEGEDQKRDEGAEGKEPAREGSPEALSSSSSSSSSSASSPLTKPLAAASSDPHDEPLASEAAREEDELGDLDEVDLREIMRQALDRPPRGAPPNILNGVQRKLRTRSRGKFYGDGWSTTRAPRSTYLITSLFMLALLAFVFLVLIPWGGGALR